MFIGMEMRREERTREGRRGQKMKDQTGEEDKRRADRKGEQFRRKQDRPVR